MNVFGMNVHIIVHMNIHKNKTKVESVQLEKILDKVFSFPPSPRPRVKCCGWDGEWGRGGRAIP